MSEPQPPFDGHPCPVCTHEVRQFLADLGRLLDYTVLGPLRPDLAGPAMADLRVALGRLQTPFHHNDLLELFHLSHDLLNEAQRTRNWRTLLPLCHELAQSFRPAQRLLAAHFANEGHSHPPHLRTQEPLTFH